MRKIRNLAIIAIFAISMLFALSIMVNAETNNVAKIGDTEYATLDAAVKDVPADGTETIITLLRDVEEGSGFKAQPNQNFIIDFAGYTYDASVPTVGSTGTETNGCQLLKESTVTFKNGTLTSTTASIIIQNYSDLTLQDMIVDGTESSVCSYALSSNCGEVKIIGNTSLYSNQNAFDMCWAPNVGYPDGTQIIVDTTGTIEGNIQLDVWGTFSEDIKSTLTLKNLNHIGEFDVDSRLASQLTVEGGTYSTDASKYLGDGYAQVKVSDSQYKVGLKATDIKLNESLNMKVGETEKLEVTVTPVDTIEVVEYVSSDSNVVTVDKQGNIEAVGAGQAEITVTVGNITKTCTVTVTKEVIIEKPTLEDGESLAGVNVSNESTELLKEETENNETVKQAIEDGKDVSVDIIVEEIKEEAVAQKDKELITESVENGNIAQYFDISLLIKIDGVEIEKIFEPSNKITFELMLQKFLLKENREFYIIRVHDGRAERIAGTLKDNIFIFQTDKFSTYALAYIDKVDNVVDDNEDNIIDSNEKDDTPKTGVESYITVAVAALIISTLSIAILGLVIAKDRK